MQASRTAHYAWLYRGSLRGQAQGWPTEVTPNACRLSGNALRPRAGTAALSPLPAPLGRSAGRGAEPLVEPGIVAGMEAAAARAHFIEAQINDAVQSGIEQLVWLGPRAAQTSTRGVAAERALAVDVEVLPLEVDTQRGARGARARLNRSLVRSARTLFVCDGLLDRSPSAQVHAILRTIGDSCFGSRLALVYLDSGSVSGHVSAGGSQRPRCAVPRLGERAQLGIEKRALPALLAGAGLVLDVDMGLSEYVRRTQGDAPSDLRGHGCFRLALAHVRAPAVSETSEVN